MKFFRRFRERKCTPDHSKLRPRRLRELRLKRRHLAQSIGKVARVLDVHRHSFGWQPAIAPISARFPPSLCAFFEQAALSQAENPYV
jgi:hypothetical protein